MDNFEEQKNDFANENNCNCEENCDCENNCDCGNECNCGAEETSEHECTCGGNCQGRGKKKEKVFCALLLTNILNTLLLATIAVVLILKLFILPPPRFVHPGFPPQRPEVQREGHAPVAEPKQKSAYKAENIFDKSYITYQKASKQNKPMLILFYADWCQYCQKFAPTYKELANDKDLNKIYNFVPVDTQDPKNESLVQEYAVTGFPTLYLVNLKEGRRTYIPNQFLFGDEAKANLKDLFIKVNENSQ